MLTLKLLALSPALALRWAPRLIAAGAGRTGRHRLPFLTGSEVPTVRSCIAALLVLLGIALGREALTLRLVAVGALVILILWPESLPGPSFQLSFAAITAIVVLHDHPRVRDMLARRDEGLAQKLGRVLLALVLTGLAVEVSLAPIALFHFHRTGLYGAFANIVAIPLTTFVIMLSRRSLAPLSPRAERPVWWLPHALGLLLAILGRGRRRPRDGLSQAMRRRLRPVVAGGVWISVRTTGGAWLRADRRGALWSLATPPPSARPRCGRTWRCAPRRGSSPSCAGPCGDYSRPVSPSLRTGRGCSARTAPGRGLPPDCSRRGSAMTARAGDFLATRSDHLVGSARYGSARRRRHGGRTALPRHLRAALAEGVQGPLTGPVLASHWGTRPESDDSADQVGRHPWAYRNLVRLSSRGGKSKARKVSCGMRLSLASSPASEGIEGFLSDPLCPLSPTPGPSRSGRGTGVIALAAFPGHFIAAPIQKLDLRPPEGRSDADLPPLLDLFSVS